jgi:flagellar basal-body rod protein FlgF
MDRLVHTALHGMRLHADNQRALMAGLANQNTVGFRRDIFSNLAAVYVDTNNEALADRVFPSRSENAVDLSIGKIMPTDNPTDIAIEGPGFLVGQDANGEPVLTRRGDFRIGTDRILRNGEGLAITGDGGPITVPPYSTIEVSPDGTVLVRPPGVDLDQPANAVGRIRLANVPIANVTRGPDGHLRPKDGNAPASDANVRVVPKSLESSNVNAIESMVEMLQSSRSYDMKVKLLTTARELDNETARLMRSDR